MRVWRLENFWRIYATWRRTRSCWAFLVFTSTNLFFEGVDIVAKGVGHSSTAIVGTGFLSSLASSVSAWVPTKVVGPVGVTGIGPAELSLVEAWGIGIEVDELWWSLPAGLCEREDGLNFLKKVFIVSCVETRGPTTEFNAKRQCRLIGLGLHHGRSPQFGTPDYRAMIVLCIVVWLRQPLVPWPS